MSAPSLFIFSIACPHCSLLMRFLSSGRTFAVWQPEQVSWNALAPASWANAGDAAASASGRTAQSAADWCVRIGMASFLSMWRSSTIARELVRDSLVALDAGSALGLGVGVDLGRDRRLLLRAHALEAVAVAALARIGALHRRPDPLGELGAVLLELLRRVDHSGDLAPDLGTRCDLARHLVHPVPGDVAIRADGAHAGPVRGVDGALVLLVHRVAHLVAAGAELQGVRRFHGGVEAAPEDDPGEKAAAGQRQQRVAGARHAQDPPKAAKQTGRSALRGVGHGLSPCCPY